MCRLSIKLTHQSLETARSSVFVIHVHVCGIGTSPAVKLCIEGATCIGF